jgi:DNA adenine methylase
MKTPIRWAGSKRALLPILKRYWAENPSARYVEPFCGSACLYFELEPAEAILGDINRELITTYRTLRNAPSKVLECVRRYPRTEVQYYRLRRVPPEALSDVEQAARFLFLNRFCFNGIYRTNIAGQFNVPYGKPKNRATFNFDAMLQASALLKTATLVPGDFATVLNQVGKGDFVYLDPPYAVAKRRVFSQYYADSFSERDLVRLRECLFAMDKKGARFVVSYADSAEGRRLSSDWHYRRVRTRRNIAGFAGDRRHAFELMASNQELRE